MTVTTDHNVLPQPSTPFSLYGKRNHYRLRSQRPFGRNHPYVRGSVDDHNRTQPRTRRRLLNRRDDPPRLPPRSGFFGLSNRHREPFLSFPSPRNPVD